MGSYQNQNPSRQRSRQNRNLSRQRSRDSLDRRMEKWIQTGKQVVDGVSGNRPGGMRGERQAKSTGANLENVGRWVEEKIDWFFEDDDDWLDTEEIHEPMPEIKENKKRPLGAISLRGPKALPPQINEIRNNLDDENEWPDEQSFKVNNWERKEQLIETHNQDFDNYSSSMNSYRRKNLPRSSRKKYY